ncbi:MAG: VanW family protein [Myxococcota bacterium]
MVAGVCAAAAWCKDTHETSAAAADTVIDGVTLCGEPIGGQTAAEVAATAVATGQEAIDRPLALTAGSMQFETTARKLGAVAAGQGDPEPVALSQTALAIGRSGEPWADLQTRLAARRGDVDLALGYRFDESMALARLLEVSPRVETPSLPTRLDLENRRVLPAERGTAVLAFDSLSAVALGLAEGEDRIALVTQQKPGVDDPLGPIADRLDVSVVLGSFDTPYKIVGADDRVHNLKLGAAAIDGTVLMPGERFSFNRTVGDRTAEAGYRYATGISAGQLVDVLGGGICQVSSTIFGAAFFGGLEIVSARPHSRPSSYVDMGLDSTVVFDSIDMKVENTFDFPVVLHMTVSGGKVRAEVLGPRRPYQVTFERELIERQPFNTVWRDDPRLQTGVERVAQRGRRGFKLSRKRLRSAGGQVVDEQAWELRYPPTTEIIRRGTSPNGETPEVKVRPKLRDPAPHLRIVQ